MRSWGSFHLLMSVIVLLGVGSSGFAQNSGASDKMRQRLEQLFIWRVSDRLALPADKESKFAEQYKKLCAEKSQLSQQLDSLLDQLDKSKTDKKATAKIFSQYQSTLKKYNDLQSREMEQMSKLFDSQKMAEYVLLKREMTQKFKDVLVQNGGNRATATQAPLKDPEVIQEK